MTQPYGPMSAQPQPQPVPPKRNTGRIVLIVLGVIAALCIGGATLVAVAASGDGNMAIRELPTVQPTESEEDAAVVEEETAEPAPEPEPEEEQLTASQEQAVGMAADYLAYSGFSRQGLIDQLEFEGFSKADAKFAVDHLDVNWKEQAVIVAEDYLEYSHFSRQGLIDQLEFEGFTTEQAEHGATEAGL